MVSKLGQNSCMEQGLNWDYSFELEKEIWNRAKRLRVWKKVPYLGHFLNWNQRIKFDKLNKINHQVKIHKSTIYY